MTDGRRRHPRNGWTVLSNDNLINLADVADRLDRTFNGLNAIQTAETYPVVSLKSNYGLSFLRDVTTETGSGTVTNVVGDGVYKVATGTTSGSTAVLESVERGRYVAGTVAIPGVGVLLSSLPTGEQVARWGYFDDNDGFGFGYDVNGAFIFRRRLGSDDIVRREDWDDPLDGTGQSKSTVTFTNLNIFEMPYRWYGSGPISFEVSGEGTVNNLLIAHIYDITGETIIQDPNLPLRIEVENNGTAADLEVQVGGRQYGILGRYQPNRRVTGETRLSQSVGTTFVPLITFQQKSAYKSVSVKTSGIDFLVSNASIVFEVRIGAVLVGASFNPPSNIDASETALKFDISASSLTNGQKIYTGVAAAGAGVNITGSGRDIPELDLPANEPVTLCARSISGTATVTSVFRAREEW